MENRYADILQKHNQEILDLCVYNPYLFYVGAFELSKIHKKEAKVLELGCGEGHSALPILERTKVSIDLLDVSKEMIASSKKRLQKYAKRTKYIQSDALVYLKKAAPYDIIFSAWTIHNFTQADKKELFSAIYNNLKPGGTFILMDKVYPKGNHKKLLDVQLKRYSYYLKPAVAKAIIKHEQADASNKYRIDEKPLQSILKEIGFKNVRLVDRIERETVFIAKK